MDMVPNPILIASVDGLTLEWGNLAATQFLQVLREDLGEFVFPDFVPERELPALWQAMEELQKGHRDTADTWLSAEDGIGLCAARLAMANDHLVITGVGHEHSSPDPLWQTDALTELPDRRKLNQQFNAIAQRKDHQWGLLFIDLNAYKRVNDQMGHIAGDRVLREFAQKLRASSRPEDLVVRYGGDEFVVLVDQVSSKPQLRTIADRIAREVFVTANEASHQFQVSCSVGIAMGDAAFSSIDQIVALADQDMYRQRREN